MFYVCKINKDTKNRPLAPVVCTSLGSRPVPLIFNWFMRSLHSYSIKLFNGMFGLIEHCMKR